MPLKKSALPEIRKCILDIQRRERRFPFERRLEIARWLMAYPLRLEKRNQEICSSGYAMLIFGLGTLRFTVFAEEMKKNCENEKKISSDVYDSLIAVLSNKSNLLAIGKVIREMESKGIQKKSKHDIAFIRCMSNGNNPNTSVASERLLTTLSNRELNALSVRDRDTVLGLALSRNLLLKNNDVRLHVVMKTIAKSGSFEDLKKLSDQITKSNKWCIKTLSAAAHAVRKCESKPLDRVNFVLKIWEKYIFEGYEITLYIVSSCLLVHRNAVRDTESDDLIQFIVDEGLKVYKRATRYLDNHFKIHQICIEMLISSKEERFRNIAKTIINKMIKNDLHIPLSLRDDIFKLGIDLRPEWSLSMKYLDNKLLRM